MKKRINLSQLRIGMFVEELEAKKSHGKNVVASVAVKSDADMQRLLGSGAMSLIIDTQKGVDLAECAPPSTSTVQQRFYDNLLSSYSTEEIAQARKAIDETMPRIRSLLGEARLSAAFQVDAAHSAVEHIMSAALHNAGAFITLSKLRTKDEYTFLHSLAVSALMITFGRILGSSEHYVQTLGLGGLVHDIGKMLIPLEIVQKPGKLTEEEMSVVRSHPMRGYELIKATAGVSPVVLDICRYHHERYDGGGYPCNLSGAAIPPAARIAAICDVYDALTSIRPYKRAWSQDQAISLMMRSPGQFDRALLKKFVSKMIIARVI